MSNVKNPVDMGANRTGIAVSLADAKQSIEGARAGSPTANVSSVRVDEVRLEYSTEVAPLGTMPSPRTLKGAARAAIGKLRGKNPLTFLDLIAERVAFERTGTRLYEALLVKHDAADPRPSGPTRAELETIRDEELRHFALLKEALENLGADSTAVTPSADVAAVAGMGWIQVLTDPRTTLTEGLKIVLMAELADNDAWRVLSDIAERLGHDNLAGRFRTALAEEDVHLARVRSWVARSLQVQAGLEQSGASATDTGAL
jgi:rubrerythrin